MESEGAYLAEAANGAGRGESAATVPPTGLAWLPGNLAAPGQYRTALRSGGMVATLVVMSGAALIFVSGFRSSYNIETLLRDAGFLGFIAVGMTFIVASGNFIDLSVVAQIAAAGVVVTVLESHGLFVAIVGAAGICYGIAAVNWLGVGVMKANCVVVTLGVETAALGALEYFTQGANYNGRSPGLHNLMIGKIGPIPYVFIMLVGVVVIAQLILTRTTIGYGTRAVGANRTAAALAGVRTPSVMAFAFLAVSTTCALAGVALAGFDAGALGNMGQGYDFNALAAVVVGGNSLLGGEGSALRTLVGVLFLEVLLNVLVLLGLPFDWQELVEGGIVVTAVALDALLRRRAV